MLISNVSDDCDWLINNIVNPSDFSDVETRCKDYFASSLELTTVVTGTNDTDDGFDTTTTLLMEDEEEGDPFSLTTVFSNTTEILKKPHTTLINASLCEWYLPTIDQTPKALGPTGIALWALGFVITFVLILLFFRQTYFIYRTAHKSFRRHLYFITSIYMVMALFTSIGSGIPRAHAVCSAIKDVYMSIGIGHFMDLTLAMYGGENVMYWYVRDRAINLRVVPICKCCFCIRRCRTKRRSVTILKWMVWQMKWTQSIYYLLKLIWIKSLENSLGIVAPNSSSFWYMHILNVVSFLSGVFSLILIGSLVKDDLEERYKYTNKTKLVRFTILTTKLQRLLFEILEACNVFPCYPPYVSQKFYKNVLKDFIYLVEVLILGLLTFFAYCQRNQFEQGNSNAIQNTVFRGVREDDDDDDDEEEALEKHDKNGFATDIDISSLRTALNAAGFQESKC